MESLAVSKCSHSNPIVACADIERTLAHGASVQSFLLFFAAASCESWNGPSGGEHLEDPPRHAICMPADRRRQVTKAPVAIHHLSGSIKATKLSVDWTLVGIELPLPQLGAPSMAPAGYRLSKRYEPGLTRPTGVYDPEGPSGGYKSINLRNASGPWLLQVIVRSRVCHLI
jgi:hypothetical protein